MRGSSTEHVAVWANPVAGRGIGADVTRRLAEAIEAFGHRAEILPTLSPDATAEAARAAIGNGIDRVVAIGGDGTVHQAIQVLAGTGIPLGIIPVGSGNDFAAALGVPSDPVTALEHALGPTTPIDLIRVGHRYAATVLTLGVSVDVTIRAGRLRWPRGPAKYTLATLLELPTMRRYPVTIDIDGQRHDIDANLLAVANTPMFGGGMRVAPSADPTDGLLDIVVIDGASRPTLLTLLPKAKKGGHIGHRRVHTHLGRRIELRTATPHRVDADGEPVGLTPTTIEVAPAALTVPLTSARARR